MLTYLLIFVGLFLIYWGFNWLWSYYQKSRFKAIGGEITPDDFEHTMRKAQIIDLRERNEFKAGHILGARDIPYTQLRERMGEMRQDLPVYLYDKTGVLSLRAARRLRKNGFKKISWLKGGYDNWSGKTKKSPTNY